MGRYLRGTKGFQYKYVYAEQSSNLVTLATAAKAGAGGLRPSFLAPVAAIQDNVEIPVLDVVRSLVRNTGDVRGLELLLHAGDVVPHDDLEEVDLEEVEIAMHARLVDLLVEIDARLSHPARALHLVGRAGYSLARTDWPALLKYVNEALPKPKRLKSAADLNHTVTAEAALRGVGETDDHCARMAVAILQHAVVHDLERLEVEEQSAELDVPKMWKVLEENHPLFERIIPKDHDKAFARGLAFHFSRRRDRAVTSLQRCHDRGDPRAQRWLAELGVTVSRLSAAEIRTKPRPRATAGDRALAKALANGETQRGAVRAKRKDRATLHSEFIKANGDVEASLEALSAGLCWKGLEVYVDSLLRKVLNHGSPAQLRRIFDVIGRNVPDMREFSWSAYDVACAAARLGERAAMLDWYATAIQRGKGAAAALTDKDFAAYHADEALRALAAKRPRKR